uniref:Bm8578 n=1 Tax=Brugia malayi TaxID=6279 RepID=A0A1I9G023_BRUMA|nr:Bm8578 [Brugia malayi]
MLAGQNKTSKGQVFFTIEGLPLQPSLQAKILKVERLPCLIVSSTAVWARWIAFFGNSFGFQFTIRGKGPYPYLSSGCKRENQNNRKVIVSESNMKYAFGIYYDDGSQYGIECTYRRTGLSAMIPPVSQLVKLILDVAADHVDCFNISYSYIRSKILLYQRGYG